MKKLKPFNDKLKLVHSIMVAAQEHKLPYHEVDIAINNNSLHFISNLTPPQEAYISNYKLKTNALDILQYTKKLFNHYIDMTLLK